jgi:hypothetical protein
MMQTDGTDLVARLGDEADELEQRNVELGQRAKDVAQEWENKRPDPNVPGVPPDDDDDGYDEDDEEHDGESWDDPDEEEEDEDYDEDE